MDCAGRSLAATRSSSASWPEGWGCRCTWLRSMSRSCIRHELLPQLTRDWNPALAENLAQIAQWAQDEEAYWSVEMDGLAAALITVRTPAVLLRSGDLCGLAPAVARRLIRRAIEV